MSLESHFVVGALAAEVRAADVEGITDVCPPACARAARAAPGAGRSHPVGPPCTAAHLRSAGLVRRFDHRRGRATLPQTSTRRRTGPISSSPPRSTACPTSKPHRAPSHHPVDGDGRRIRRRAAVHVPDDPALAATPGPQVPESQDGHAGAHGGPRRLLHRRLLGAGRGRISDVGRRADTRLPDFQDSMVLFRSGDIVEFTPIDEDEYGGFACAAGRDVPLPASRDRVRPRRMDH